MDQQKEPQMSAEESKDALRQAKERLSDHAEQLSLKEYMVKHPYISLGAAFFSGVLAGGSQDALEDIAKALISAVSKEVINRDK